MILCFPDLDTFRLVVTSTMLPTEVTLAPARAHLAPDGRLFLDTPAKLAKKVTGELTNLGISAVKTLPAAGFAISCWLQVLPATKDAHPPQLASQAAVLFELPTASELPAIVGEMLRLGNDRQSFRWLADDQHQQHRVLLRVIGPPYYTLLRALDHLGSADSPPVRAYVEAAPRVWVQIGHTHPAASIIKPAEGQILLIRTPREWEYIADEPFQDVYQILQFKLPTAPVDWSPTESLTKLEVKMKLVPGNAADSPELWVLKGDAIQQLDEFVRDTDERLTSRLKFAVADSPDGEKVVVLRVSPSKLAPPALQFRNATGFKPYFKLPNLYLPAGTRLHPQLRRDAVRNLLADDTDRLVWLYPKENGQFVPETLSENAFRPLEDWVEYIIETAHAPLKEWMEASRFQFESFLLAEDAQKPKPPDKPPTRGKLDRGEEAPAPNKPARGKKPGTEGDQVVSLIGQGGTITRPPNEWRIKREELEKQFLAIDGPLDTEERIALWPQLAEANAGAGDLAEAAICWANAAWQNPTAAILSHWGASEYPDSLTESEFDALLAQREPNRLHVRQTLAATFSLLTLAKRPAWFASRLPAVQRYFETNEDKISVRAVWVLATAIARTTGADVLGLARVRDRLLNRLLESGLNPELDVPFFLRSAGLQDSERVRQVRDRLPELHKAARAWVLKSPQSVAKTAPDIRPTLPYLDLLFAFGFARLGSSNDANRLMQEAQDELLKPHTDPDEAMTRGLLYRGFAYRIEQALANKPHFGPLPAEIMEKVEAFQDRYRKAPPNDGRVGHYPLSRLRSESRILEPIETHDTYLEFLKHDQLKKALNDLETITDPEKLRQRIRELHKNGVGGLPHTADHRFLVLHDTILRAARLGETFALEMLAHVPQALATVGPGVPQLALKQGKLLERSLLVAAHFDDRESIRLLVTQFVNAVHAKSDEGRFEIINFVASQCLRSLRRFGLTEDVERLLRALSTEILGPLTPSQLRGRFIAEHRQLHWMKALQSLAGLAGGLLAYGSASAAEPLLEEVRHQIFTPAAAAASPNVIEFTSLVSEYAAALGSSATDAGLERTLELFRKLDPARITNTLSTGKSYSRLHLKVIEAVVLAVASDDFSLGAVGRRWMEDDEYLVRRRIHADMRRHLSGSGL